MQHRDENTQRATEPVLTTEDLAHPAQAPVTGHGTEPRTGREAGRDTGPDTGLDTGTEPGTEPGIGTGTGTGIGTGRDTAVYPGEATGDPSRPDTFGDGVRGDGIRSAEADAHRADEARSAEADAHRPEENRTGDTAEGAVPRASGPPGDTAADGEAEPLLGTAEAEGYRTSWTEIQGRFVDDPREAVRSADTLVAEVMQAFAGTLADHRGRLEKQWDSGEQVATEDLRQALRAYRSLINRLLDT
ncbi:hypothetical protein [Streptomyces sp. NPDC002044]|uniref:hypothetical protein n=1 Tax=Streptomyces sp. NPDC002044 TaxID=3154662 RepID=UPI003322CF82